MTSLLYFIVVYELRFPFFSSSQVSNKADAGILVKATAAGVPSLHVPCAKTTSRDEYDAAVTAALTDAGAELVLCIGWMRILSPSFCQRWAGRCLNVHPSLLPAFAGGMDGDVHAAVLAAGAKVTGCTVHWVTEEVDGGAHVVQKECPVVDGDTPETLKAKVRACAQLLSKWDCACCERRVL